MKKLIVFGFLLFAGVTIGQDKSEINSTKYDVYSIVVERFSPEWYENQAKLWKAEMEANKTNAKAYYNYYMALRGMRNLSESDEKRKTFETTMAEVTTKCYETLPDSFEANEMMYSNSQFEKTQYLYRAFEIDPNRSTIYNSLVTESELEYKLAKRKEFCQLIYRTNSIGAPILNWGYNLLAGLDENAILLTHGDNDTYSAWVNQDALGIRTDVRVINAFLIMKDEYRKEVFKELGIADAYKASPEFKSEEEYSDFRKEIVKTIIDKCKRSFYSSSQQDYIFSKEQQSNFYLVGLPYKYSEANIDNLSIIRNRFENDYLLDYLTINFTSTPAQSLYDGHATQYLPALIKLYNHYTLTGEQQKAEKTKALILLIAGKNDMNEDILKQLTIKC